MDPTAHTSVEPHMQELLAHSAWVQRLARRLVRDPGLADDLVQETFVAALGHSGGPVRSARAFLGTVLRRLVWERRRRDERRALREQFVAAEEALPSTGDIVERMACHARVVEHVLDLPEHYRHVLLLRYFEGLTPTQIAEREELALPTVKTRLQRGLNQMRERLDRESGGDGSTWLAALGPLTSWRPGIEGAPAGSAGAGLERTAGAPLGTTASGAGVALALGGLAAVALGLLGWWALAAQVRPEVGIAPSAPPLAAGPQVSPGAAGPGAGVPSRAGPGPRVAVPGGAAALPVGALYALESERGAEPLRGRVVDQNGARLGGIVLAFAPARASGRGTKIAVSAADGSFELRGARGLGLVEALGPGYVTLAAGLGGAGADDELSVVLSRARPVAGRLVDASRRPIEGGELELLLPAALLANWSGSGTALPRRIASSTADGEFAFEAAPDLPGVRLVARAEGFVRSERLLDPGPAEGLELALALPGASSRRVSGRVRTAAGEPVEGASVSLGQEIARSDAGGRFALDLPRVLDVPRAPEGPESTGADPVPDVPAGPAVLVALHPEHGGTTLRFEPAETGVSTAGLEVILAGAQPELTGRVVDAAGRGLPGVPVWLDDPTPFSGFLDEDSAERLEALNSEDGPNGRFQESRLFGLPAIDPTGFPDTLEGRLGGTPTDAWCATRTDAEGRFHFAGLLPRAYRLAAMDPATLGIVRSAAGVVPGGPGCDLVMDPVQVLGQVRGRLVDDEGHGLAGVELDLVVGARRLELEGRTVHRLGFLRSAGRTGPDGQFHLPLVPVRDARLVVAGAGLVDAVFELEIGAGQEFRVQRALAVRVELSSATFIEFSVLDGEGAALPLQRQLGGRREAIVRAALHSGRSDLFEVNELGRTLRLYRQDGSHRDQVLLRAGSSPFVQRD